MSSQSNQTAGDASAKRPRKRQRRQLRVVFDTNVLWADSASYLVRADVASLITQSKFPDLDITWYLPDVVRHERQYQMQKRALALLPAVEKVETLLGHKLNITDEVLLGGVEKAVSKWHNELGLVELKLDYGKVGWDQLVLDATYRRRPFEDGEKEKGFRDALVIESYFQLVAQSPKTPEACRLVLLTADSLVAKAVEERISGSANTSVLSSLEELRGLINTLASAVDEAYLAELREKAEKFFFVPKDEGTLFYKEGIREKITEKFSTQLATVPPGAARRRNKGWTIYHPNFSRKERQRVFWTSRIGIEIEASKTVHEPEQSSFAALGLGASWPGLASPFSSPVIAPGMGSPPPPIPLSALATLGGRSVTTHKGRESYDVAWSVDVTRAQKLRRPAIEDITHVETTWEQVA